MTKHMLYSPLTDCVHMTGGTATHDAIVWGGSPEEQAQRRAANDPLLKVPAVQRMCVGVEWTAWDPTNTKTKRQTPPARHHPRSWLYPPIVLHAPLPCQQVPITSELGCVTPWLVVPGPWSQKEVVHHARALAEGEPPYSCCRDPPCQAAAALHLPARTAWQCWLPRRALCWSWPRPPHPRTHPIPPPLPAAPARSPVQ